MLEIISMMHKTFLIILFSWAVGAQAGLSANLYDLKSNRDTKLFTSQVNIVEEPTGYKTLTVFKDLQGVVVVEEQGEVKNGEIVRFEISRPQTKEKGSYEVRDGKIYFSYENAKGKKKEDSEKLRSPLVGVVNFNYFVNQHWEELSQGKEIDIRFPVWDRLETVGFALKKVGEPTIDGVATMEIRMKPSSMLIAALVDPIFLYYAKSDRSLKVQKGRVAPKIQHDGHWKDLDAEVVYTKD